MKNTFLAFTVLCSTFTYAQVDLLLETDKVYAESNEVTVFRTEHSPTQIEVFLKVKYSQEYCARTVKYDGGFEAFGGACFGDVKRTIYFDRPITNHGFETFKVTAKQSFPDRADIIVSVESVSVQDATCIHRILPKKILGIYSTDDFLVEQHCDDNLAYHPLINLDQKAASSKKSRERLNKLLIGQVKGDDWASDNSDRINNDKDDQKNNSSVEKKDSKASKQ
ncbi:MAG TPA: hypothetical protein VNJ08_06330 [Bacteriovoracaceae bacterium]|nr:hypothetical protein [Bacteriovoracaceae bacterium]